MFEENGYFGVGLETVAGKAGVSRQAIYLHFASKADLLRALARTRERARRRTRHSRRSGPPRPPTAALDAWVDATAEAVPKFIGIANMLNAARRSDPDVRRPGMRPRKAHYAELPPPRPRLKQEKQLIPRMSAADAADILWMPDLDLGLREPRRRSRVAPRPLGPWQKRIAPHAALRRHRELTGLAERQVVAPCHGAWPP